MNKKLLFRRLVAIFLLLCLFVVTTNKANARSFLASKTEVPIDLEISGVEAIEQTDDGYMWIGQYSGLTRYDSKEFVTYKEFNDNGKTYNIVNVRNLIADGNKLYIATTNNLFLYENNTFKNLYYYQDNPDFNPDDVASGNISHIELAKDSDTIYISTYKKGLVVFNLKTLEFSVYENTNNKTVYKTIYDEKRNDLYYLLEDGIHDKDGNIFFSEPTVTAMCIYEDNFLIATQVDSKVYTYDLNSKSEKEIISVNDQVNYIYYYEKDSKIFMACESKGVCCIDLETYSMTFADNLENKSQLVDLLVDYEGNIWIASHNIAASGLSMIANNALLDMLYDDPIWQSLDLAPSKARNVQAIERYANILYICSGSGVYMYDLEKEKILEDNPVMDKWNEYFDEKGIIDASRFALRDAEVCNNKIYFATTNFGLIEYDPTSNACNIYDSDYISAHINETYNSPDLNVTNYMRSLRAIDGELYIGYNRGIMRFDGTSFTINATGSNVLFIEKFNDNILFDMTKGLFIASKSLETITELETEKEIAGNRLKFLIDGNCIYYNLNSRLFRMEYTNGKYITEEVVVPHVKGSIVELAKIKTSDKIEDKYVICSQTQIYITDSLKNNILVNYELYDETNGLRPIIANTSGYYNNNLYYFPTTDGIFVYDFGNRHEKSVPLKVAINSINADGKLYYGNTLKISRNTDRLTFNLSVFGFRPNKGYKIYYKLDGVDKNYVVLDDQNTSISYTNLKGGKYQFHFYVVDENDQKSNQIDISLTKVKKIHEHITFVVLVVFLGLALIVGALVFYFRRKIKQSIKRQLEYKKITLESIEAIARTIDAKDAYTNGHSRRVGYYSREIAKAMNLPEKQVENIFYTALLHDIGKIAIPLKILNKPARLDDAEFEIMKTHTTKGGKILKDISTIPGIVEGAMYHHEKWNGTGYPTGLKGTNIPLNARIICCADCFDAMATKRSYKEPCSKEYIISEFERCSGTQFDPDVAKVIVELIKEDKFKTIIEENKEMKNDIITMEDSKEDE